METLLVTSDAQGPVTFPSYSDGPLSSPNWTNCGKQYITLPASLFSDDNSLSTNGKYNTIPEAQHSNAVEPQSSSRKLQCKRLTSLFYIVCCILAIATFGFKILLLRGFLFS